MRFYLLSLGCKVNSYELNALRLSLLSEGHTEVFSPEEADLEVINTCSVTSTADQKSRQHIRKLRRASPQAVLAVLGCHSELHAQEVAAMGADIVLGTADRGKLLSYLPVFLADRRQIVDVKSSVRHERYEELGGLAAAEGSRAYLKIQDGCDNFCSYCLIPTLRGNSRSRDRLSCLLEARRLVEAGVKEIVIAGIHIGGYGKDLGDGSYRLPDLVNDLLAEVPNLYRLRISSLEESEIDDRLLQLLKEHSNIADHFHIPLQSGSSSVLTRMKRKYDTEAFLATLERIRSVRPEIAITTDIIVGFPGESDEEWAETIDFAKRARFSEIHVFPFSPRQGTLAYAMKDQVDAETKKKRVGELLALSKELRQGYERLFYGKKLDVLFEDYDEAKLLSRGHTSNYLLVGFPTDGNLTGKVKTIVYSQKVSSD